MQYNSFAHLLSILLSISVSFIKVELGISKNKNYILDAINCLLFSSQNEYMLDFVFFLCPSSRLKALVGAIVVPTALVILTWTYFDDRLYCILQFEFRVGLQTASILG